MSLRTETTWICDRCTLEEVADTRPSSWFELEAPNRSKVDNTLALDERRVDLCKVCTRALEYWLAPDCDK